MRISSGGVYAALACMFYSVGMMAALDGCGGDVVSPSSGGAGIEHVVVIVQENRTPDNLFHGLPNADIADSGMNSAGETITLTAMPLSVPFDLDHSHGGFIKMYDGGKMDGADKLAARCTSKGANCPPSNTPFNYVDPAEVQPYFEMAEQHTFADRMFQTNNS